jgi:hypothetical protein
MIRKTTGIAGVANTEGRHPFSNRDRGIIDKRKTSEGGGMEAPVEDRERTWAMLCHLTAFVVLLGVPFGNILGPFIVWIFKKNDYPRVDEQGKESMNFQISMTIYTVITLLIAVSLTPVLIGFLFYPLAGIIVAADFILTVIATVRASNNVPYRYPLSLRLIK